MAELPGDFGGREFLALPEFDDALVAVRPRLGVWFRPPSIHEEGPVGILQEVCLEIGQRFPGIAKSLGRFLDRQFVDEVGSAGFVLAVREVFRDEEVPLVISH